MKNFTHIIKNSLLSFSLCLVGGSSMFAADVNGWGDFKLYLDPGHAQRENGGLYNYSEAEKVLRVAWSIRDYLLKYTDIQSENEMVNITTRGVYVYKDILDNGDTVFHNGFLIVRTSSAYNRRVEQVRIDTNGIYFRTATYNEANNSLSWGEWKEIDVDPNRIAFSSDGTEFAATDLNKPRTEGRMSLGSNGDVGVSVGNNGELGIGVNRNSKYYPVMEVKKDNKTRFTPVGSPYVMAQMEKGRMIFSSDQVGNSEVGVHLDLNGKVATLKAEDKINLESVNETSIKSSGLYVSGIGGYDGTNPGTAKTLQEVVNEGGGITDLGVVSGWNDVVDTGIYKYTLTTENGISGLLFVTSAPKRDGSGKDHYQVRMEAGKIYSRTGESLKIASGRYTWQDWEEVGGGSSVSVVQSTGQSTTAAMSQKAVTDELGKAYLLSDDTKDELIQIDWGKSTNGEPLYYIDHWLEDLQAADPSIFTYDDQVHTLKLAQITVGQELGLDFIETSYRGVLLDPTWSYVNFVYSGMEHRFSARIGGGKCILCDAAGFTNNADYYVQLYAEVCYTGSNGISVTIFAEHKLPPYEDENPLYINDSLAGRLRIWIV